MATKPTSAMMLNACHPPAREGGPARALKVAAPHLERGQAAEHMAERYLKSQGLIVLARNFRCRSGELDLVCLDGSVLAMVEVRQRTRADFGGPLASVRVGKQRRLIRTAAHFLLRSARWRGHVLRFDVVAVDGLPEATPHIAWIKDAFRAR